MLPGSISSIIFKLALPVRCVEHPGQRGPVIDIEKQLDQRQNLEAVVEFAIPARSSVWHHAIESKR